LAVPIYLKVTFTTARALLSSAVMVVYCLVLKPLYINVIYLTKATHTARYRKQLSKVM